MDCFIESAIYCVIESDRDYYSLLEYNVVRYWVCYGVCYKVCYRVCYKVCSESTMEGFRVCYGVCYIVFYKVY